MVGVALFHADRQIDRPMDGQINGHNRLIIVFALHKPTRFNGFKKRRTFFFC